MVGNTFKLKNCMFLIAFISCHPHTSQRLKQKLIVRATDFFCFPLRQLFLFISPSSICNSHQICLYHPFLRHICLKMPMVLTLALEKDGFVMKARFRHPNAIWLLVVMQVSPGAVGHGHVTCRDS